MFKYFVDKWNQWFGAAPEAPGTGMSFKSSSAVIEAFTDPNSLPTATALELIDTVVANRSDANELREALAVRFIKERGITMFGTAIQDRFAKNKDNPDHNPNTLYVAPYARATVGAQVMSSYQDDMGEVYVAVARNWKDQNDHSKGAWDHWRLPGGYMSVRQPNDPANRPYDHNLDVTAERELYEETGLRIDKKHDTLTQLLVQSDCGSDKNTPNHPINAYYLHDAGRHQSPPAITASDDVAELRWVNIRAFKPVENSAQLTVDIDGKATPFHPDHGPAIEKGVSQIRKKLFPLHDEASMADKSHLSATSHAHFDRVAQAHGFKPKAPEATTPDSAWQDRMAAKGEAKLAAVH